MMIPSEWHQALADSPGDYTLRLVIADYMQEQGEELGAEVMRLTVLLRITPYNFSRSSKQGSYGWESTCVSRLGAHYTWWKEVPMRPFLLDPVHSAFDRLIIGWKALSEEEREGIRAELHTNAKDYQDEVLA